MTGVRFPIFFHVPDSDAHTSLQVNGYPREKFPEREVYRLYLSETEVHEYIEL